MRVALMALKNLVAAGPMSLEYAVVEKGLSKALANRALQAGWAGRGGMPGRQADGAFCGPGIGSQAPTRLSQGTAC